MKRDANLGAGVESGTSHKEKMGGPLASQKTVGNKDEGKSAPNPSTKAPRGHTIK